VKKTLLSLIKYSVLPALLLFVGKLAGILIVSNLFNIKVQFSLNDYNIFFFKIVVDAQSFILLSSYSDIIMYLIMILGMTFILFQALIFHDSHISNETLFKLAKFNLLNLVRSSYELYHSGAIWILFMWMATLLVSLNTIKGTTYVWVMGFCLVFSISYSIIFTRDLFSEISLLNNEQQK
jgi:hypothetical protein